MNALFAQISLFLNSEEGPTATEYAVLLSVIAIGVLGAMSAFGDHVNNIYLTLAGTVPVASGS